MRIKTASVLSCASFFLISSSFLAEDNATPSELNDSLLLHWTFNEKQGQQAFDSSGKGHHGKVFGTANWVEGKAGGSFAFDGSTSVMGDLEDELLDEGFEDAPFSISAWVKAAADTDMAGDEKVVAGRPGYHSGIMAESNEGGIQYYFAIFGKDREKTAVRCPPLKNGAEWHHVVATYSSRKMRVYLDGAMEAEAAYDMGIHSLTRKFVAGGVGPHSFAGAIDDVRVYGKALNPHEVEKLFGERDLSEPEQVPLGKKIQIAKLERDRAELRIPFTTGKPVVAHYMTQVNLLGNGRWILDADLYNPDGKTKNIGGAFQFRALLPDALASMSPEDAVAFEMNAAKKIGIDGFHFYYKMWPLGPLGEVAAHENNRIISLFFKVAEERGIDFKLTLCLSQPSGPWSAEEKVAAWASRIKPLLDKTRASSKWLRDESGKIAFLTWAPEGLSNNGGGGTAELLASQDIAKEMESLAESYAALAKEAGIDAAVAMHVNTSEHMRHACRNLNKGLDVDRQFKSYVEETLAYFPAVTGFIDMDSERDREDWRLWIERCSQKGRSYGQSVFPEFYDSKLIDMKTKKMIHSPANLAKLSVADAMRYYIPVKGSSHFRALWQRAIDADANFVSQISWNDYPEGHHMAPEINHNYAFSLLAKHYRKVWRHEKAEPEEQDELAMAFYRKYPSTATPSLYDIKLDTMSWVVSPDEMERMKAEMDVVEVVCILKSPAEVFINGSKIADATSGLSVSESPMKPGPVRIEVRRDGRTAISVNCPEWITDKPYRTDRLVYAYSNKCEETGKEIFGGLKLPKSDEYAEDDGRWPNWMKRLSSVRDEISPANKTEEGK